MRSAKYIQKLKTINRVQKASTPGERVISSLFPNRTTSYGWDQNVAEQVAHFRNWTYVAVNAICCRMGGLFPNLAYVVDAEKPGLTVKGKHRGLLNTLGRGFGGSCTMDWAGHSYLTMGEWRSKALSVIKPHDDLEPMGNDHPLRRLLENPNPVDTTFDLLYESQMFQELCGVSYIWAVPNSLNGTPCELWVIPTHWVWPRTGGGLHVSADHPHAGELIEYYEVRPWGGAGASGLLKFPPNEIIMERWKSPQNKIGGWSKLTAGSQWIDTEESISRSRWAQFINQARPEFWLELAQGYEDPDDNMIARIESKFMSRMQGEGNYGKPVITPPGAKITPLSFSPTEMAYFSCSDALTECLTDNGWKKYTELTKETKIACFNQETKCLEYHTPKHITVQDYDGPMHYWKSKEMDLMVTPNHRMMVRVFDQAGNSTESWGGDWQIVQMKDMPINRHFRVKTSAPIVGESPKTVHVPKYRKFAKGGSGYDSPEGTYEIDAKQWARFLGWYVSEGHLSKDRSRVTISQKIDSPHTPEIESLLKSAFPMEWSRNVCGGKDNRGCYQWFVTDKGLHRHLEEHCGKTARLKSLPKYVMGWSSELLLELLEAAISGDGNNYGENRFGHETWKYRTTSKQLAEDVAEIAVKCGKTVTIWDMTCRDYGEENYPMFHVNMSSKTYANAHVNHQHVIPYKGKVWCVTVPTGLFVVRRNGKVHVTGNSEEQIRDMILSLFQVPKAAVGISDGLTFGSVLATLASMCSQCINPRLQMRGQTLTKHLASRWSQPGRRAKLWWDDVTPADPAQVNADISCDLQGHAISPNEIRALRGRPSYEHGGDDPLVSGPGGIVPLPLNTGEDQQDLADLLKPFTQPEQAEQQAMEGGPLELPEGGEEQPLAIESKPLDMDAGVEEPNGEPTKSVKHWDEWFKTINHTKEWNAAKSVCKTDNELLGWAHIIEMNRLNQKIKDAKTIVKSTADAVVGDLSNYLNSLPEEYKEGLYVWVNQGPPKLAIVDFMDWFDGDAGVQQDIKSQASKWTGDEQRVIVQNEGGKPGPEWQQVFPNKYDKAIEFSTEKELNAYLKKNNLVRKSVVASGLAVIARDTGRVLMLQRHIDDHRGGTWEFPGGKIEGNGDPLESAKREWFEETGIGLPDGKIVDNWRGTNGKYEGFVYQVAAEDAVDIVNRRLDTNPDGDVFEVVAWVSPKDFDNHNLRPELLADLEHLQRATQNKSFKVSNSLKYIAKYAVRKADGGSCKPGERADLTGCTPLSGEGGAKTTETPSSAGNSSKVKTAIVDNFKAAAEKFSDVKETMLTIGEIGGSVLPESVQTVLVKTYGAVRFVEHKLMTGYNKSREMAETVAIERGLGEEHAKMVGKAVGFADLAVGWTIQAPAILLATGGNVAAAKVGTWIPACSLGYIVYSTARNPMATIRAAKKMLSGKKEEPKKSRKTARKPAKKKVKK